MLTKRYPPNVLDFQSIEILLYYGASLLFFYLVTRIKHKVT